MAKTHTLTIQELTAFILTETELRTGEAALLKTLEKDYAALMKRENTFPPVIVGTVTNDEGVVTSILVDGVLRVHAADQAGLKEFAVETVAYDSVELALADRLKRNQGRGKDVTPFQRNAWIKMLKQKGMAQNEIADAVNLTEASVSRILKGQQGEGMPGLKNKGKKAGDRAARGSKKDQLDAVDITTAEGFYNTLSMVVHEISANKALILRENVTEERIDTAEATLEALKNLVKDLHRILPRKKAA